MKRYLKIAGFGVAITLGMSAAAQQPQYQPPMRPMAQGMGQPGQMMNDPQMQARMEQMRAQMEQMREGCHRMMVDVRDRARQPSRR